MKTKRERLADKTIRIISEKASTAKDRLTKWEIAELAYYLVDKHGDRAPIVAEYPIICGGRINY